MFKPGEQVRIKPAIYVYNFEQFRFAGVGSLLITGEVLTSGKRNTRVRFPGGSVFEMPTSDLTTLETEEE